MQPTILLTYETLARLPLAFRAWTGLTPAEFDDLLADVKQAHDAAERDKRSRQPAPGTGHPHALALAERLLLSLIYIRHRPHPMALGVWFGVGRTTTWRSRQSVVPLLAAVGRDDLLVRTPDEARRREIDAALDEMPRLNTMSEWFRWGNHWDWEMPPRRSKPGHLERLRRLGLVGSVPSEYGQSAVG